MSEGVERYKKDQFGSGNIIILFKYTIDAVDAIKQGLDVKELNIGQSSSGKDKDGNPRSLILRAIYLSKPECEGLREIAKTVHVFSQGSINENSVEMIPLLDKANM